MCDKFIFLVEKKYEIAEEVIWTLHTYFFDIHAKMFRLPPESDGAKSKFIPTHIVEKFFQSRVKYRGNNMSDMSGYNTDIH